jgi:predicted DNA-binding transcriptional regulator YafY
MWDDEKYYLVAFDDTDKIIKNFRVDKMQDVTVLEETATKGEEFDKFNPADYSKKIFGMYGGREELVTLECREKLAGVMIDRFGTDHAFIKTDFGFKFSLRVMVSPNFYAWILGFGNDIRILSPDATRVEFVEKIREISENYQ